MPVNASVDLSSVMAGLDRLSGVAESLARSMAVAAGQAVRDEAKARAPVDTGKLRDALYLAYREGRSSESQVVYSVTWNSKKAPHGHLLEFGHWRYNEIINGKAQKSLAPGLKRGRGPQDHTGPGALEHPVWVPAYPFLRPAYEAVAPRMAQIMVERGRERLPELLRGAAGDVESDE